jgi:two-component system chemotaxis response regulator CheB
MTEIKVFIIDDSALVRQSLKELLAGEPTINVLGAAPDPIFALERMGHAWPDVIILDIEMPRMDGITFLKKIMQENPTPVIICSSLAEKGAQITLDALHYGALEIITKPKIGLKEFFEESREILVTAVRNAALVDMHRVKKMANIIATAKPFRADIKTIARDSRQIERESRLQHDKYNIEYTTDKVVAIGTSVGGTQALEVLLPSLPITCPGIVIVQHMPEKFTTAFANRLNRISEIEVREAASGDRILPGLALIAPGNKHLVLERSGAQYVAGVKDGPLVRRHRPSVDVLFRSVAKNAGKNALGIIMTGMGNDGAAGMEDLHNTGAQTIAQNEETSIVFGMPNEAIKKNAVDKVVPLDQISAEILKYYRG